MEIENTLLNIHQIDFLREMFYIEDCTALYINIGIIRLEECLSNFAPAIKKYISFFRRTCSIFVKGKCI